MEERGGGGVTKTWEDPKDPTRDEIGFVSTSPV